MGHCTLIPYYQLTILQDLSSSSSFADVADWCILRGKVKWELGEEWAVQPPGNNVAAIPDEATAMAINFAASLWPTT